MGNFKKRLAKIKLRIDRGREISTFFGLDYFLLPFSFLIAIQNLFQLPFMVLAIFGINYTIGYLDEHYGIWKIENDYYMKNLIPFLDRMDRKHDRTQRKLKRIEISLDKKLNRILRKL